MRFLHTADLHLGKRLSDVSFLEDQRDALCQLTNMAIAEKVDAVLIAGDIYQRSSPQSEAMTVFHHFVTGLSQKNIKVFAISGNHDSDQRVSYFSELLKTAGVYMSAEFTGTLQQISLTDEFGPIVIHLLPFIRPLSVRRFYPDETIETYEDAVSAVLHHSSVDTSKRNVLVCHQLMTGAEASGAEDITIGGLDNINAGLFDNFDYVAMGHIHRAQRAGRDTCRYSGSPLKYAFSEAKDKKSAVLVDLCEKGTCKIKLLPFHPKRDMREISGLFADVKALPFSEDYVRITLHDELLPPDAWNEIRFTFPNMLKFGIENSKTKTETETSTVANIEDKSIPQLFADFYRLQNSNAEPPESVMKLLENTLAEMEEKKYEAN